MLTLECEFVRVRGPIAKGEGRALVGDEVAAEAMLTVFVAANDRHRQAGAAISITGLGCNVPERVVTNEELAPARRHLRRVDHGAHRHPRAADGRPRGGALGSGAARRAAGAGAGGHRREGRRPAHRRHGDSRHGVPLDRGDRRRPARRGGRGRLRPLGRLHRLHVRDRAGLRDARRRAREAGARRRRRHPLPAARLGRPLDARPLRRRRRGRRAGERARAGLPRLRARRRRGRRLEPLAARQRLPPVHGPRAIRQDERARGVQVRDANPRPVGRGAARTSAAPPSTTWISTSPIRQTCGSSTTQPGSWASRRRGWW